MAGNTIDVSPEVFKTSYNLLFAEQIPEVLFYQRDRPHYYNLMLKMVGLFVLMALIVPLTIIPIYPFLSVLLTNNFNIAKTFGGGTGKMNLYWLGLMYLFYIFHMTNVTASNGAASTSDNAGGGTFIGMFMGLTPIVLLLTWWYAMPTTVHDIFVEMYNGIYGSHPMLPGGIAYSSMRCPGDVQTRLVESTSSAGSQTGGGTGNAFRVLGMGLTELGLVSLMGIVLTLVVAYMWSYRLEAVVGSHSKLNADTDSLRKNTVVIRNN